jgi:hypothetical protein
MLLFFASVRSITTVTTDDSIIMRPKRRCIYHQENVEEEGQAQLFVRYVKVRYY